MKNRLNFAKYLLKLEKKAYNFARKQKLEVQNKRAHDLVTSYDFNVEKFLIKKLKKSFPDVKIVSEEYNSATEPKGTYFTIDPIDGTINFANNSPDYGVQIAYVENDEIVSAAIYMPKYKAGYIAGKGCGAYKNGKRIFVTPRPLDHSLIDLFYTKEDKSVVKIGEEIKNAAMDNRRCGACCKIYASLLENILGAYVSCKNHNAWDIYPGKLISSEAGCVSYEKDKWLVVASSQENLNTLLSIINKKRS